MALADGRRADRQRWDARHRPRPAPRIGTLQQRHAANADDHPGHPRRRRPRRRTDLRPPRPRRAPPPGTVSRLTSPAAGAAYLWLLRPPLRDDALSFLALALLIAAARCSGMPFSPSPSHWWGFFAAWR